MPLKEAVEEIVKSVVQNVQQEVEKRLAAIVDEKLAEVKNEIVELAKERVIESIVAELKYGKPALAPPTPITLTKVDVLGHTPIYKEFLEAIGEFGRGKSFGRNEIFAHLEAQFKRAEFWRGFSERTKLDYINRHLSYLKKFELAKLEGKNWGIVPGIKAGLMNLLSKMREAPAEKEMPKREKSEHIKLARLTRIDSADGGRRPIYKEVSGAIVEFCSREALKKNELLRKLDGKLAATDWAKLSAVSKKGYVGAHLRYLRVKGSLQSKKSRWSTVPAVA